VVEVRAEIGVAGGLARAGRRRRLFFACGLVAVAALTGCSSTVIDARKAREAVRDDVERKTGVAVRSVSCPTDVEVFPNETFSCRVVAGDGRVAEVELRIRNFEADVETISIEAAPG
jgi:hypothetical protein